MKYLKLTLILFFFFGITRVYAIDAEIIKKDITININDKNNSKLIDQNKSTITTIDKDELVIINSRQKIASFYIIYKEYSVKGKYYTNNTNNYKIIGQNEFLHEYVRLTTPTNIINLSFEEKANISEIYFFTEGNKLDWVQQWNLEKSPVDLLLFSTHSDDEQLFFAGLLPHYVNYGCKIQVVYVTNHHNNNYKRLHEQLDGLWEIGVTNYPLIGPFPDAYSTTLDGAIKNLKNKSFSFDDVVKFQVNSIRKYQPLVIVGHDEKGEYSHGQHILNTAALKVALTKTNDNTYITDNNIPYEVPKVYLHLYKDNKIVMNYDIPLEHFNGLTAYEVSKKGFKHHESQQYTWFKKWLRGNNDNYTKATQITKYSPLQFGLYQSKVGEDINKNDMFENLIIRKNRIIKTTTTNKISISETQKKINYFNYIAQIIPYCCMGIVIVCGILIIYIKKK